MIRSQEVRVYSRTRARDASCLVSHVRSHEIFLKRNVMKTSFTERRKTDFRFHLKELYFKAHWHQRLIHKKQRCGRAFPSYCQQDFFISKPPRCFILSFASSCIIVYVSNILVSRCVTLTIKWNYQANPSS